MTRYKQPRPALKDPQGIIWDETMAKFRDGFDDERYLVEAIKKFLLTEDQRRWLFDNRLEVADLLNGRVEGEALSATAYAMFDAWNERLGFRCFGFEARA